MKIKKPTNTTPAAAPGGATIADRFRLDAGPAKPKGPTVNKTAVMCAFSAAFLAAALLGILAYMLNQHMAFLQGV